MSADNAATTPRLQLSKPIVLILLGAAAQVLLQRLFRLVGDAATIDLQSGAVANWYGWVAGPLDSLVAVAPAFVAGWLAGRNGAIMGAAIGALSSFAHAAMFSAHVSFAEMVLAPSLLAEFLFLQIAYAFGAAIIPAVAGVAGQPCASPELWAKLLCLP
jgi:hypothetical protein